MGFNYQPCPGCSSTEIKLSKIDEGRCYAECQACHLRLEMTGRSMFSCAHTWNVRAQRRAEAKLHDMSMVCALQSDISNNPQGQKTVTLPNNEEMWKIARGAEVAWNMEATPIRPAKQEIEIRYEVLMPYLNALVEETKEKMP